MSLSFHDISLMSSFCKKFFHFFEDSLTFLLISLLNHTFLLWISITILYLSQINVFFLILIFTLKHFATFCSSFCDRAFCKLGNEICTVNIREGILNATSTCEKAKSSIISSSAHDNSETLYELHGRNNFPWPRSRRWCNYVAKFSFRKEKFEQTRCWILLYLLSIKPYRCQRNAFSCLFQDGFTTSQGRTICRFIWPVSSSR